jgi:hypothetical protein
MVYLDNFTKRRGYSDLDHSFINYSNETLRDELILSWLIVCFVQEKRKEYDQKLHEVIGDL